MTSISPQTSDILKKPALRSAWIHLQLKMRDLSLAKLARREGVDRRAMTQALRLPNIHLETTIAEAIGMTAEQLFPERFHEGRRLHKVLDQKRSRARTARQSQKNVAA